MQMCQMDLMLRYFDLTENRVKVRYWDSLFLGHACHQDLLNSFYDTINNLGPNRLFQISMDGASVKMTFYSKIV